MWRDACFSLENSTEIWDVVTIQQVSGKSPYYETYQPYLNKIVEYVRLCVPKAKIAIHQTWAYEQDSHRLNVELGYNYHTDMFKDIEISYKKASEQLMQILLFRQERFFKNLLHQELKKYIEIHFMQV